MKTCILMALVASTTGIVFAQMPAAEIATPALGAVAALGSTLLLIVGKYLPQRDKTNAAQQTQFMEANAKQAEAFTDAIKTVTHEYTETTRELMLKK